MVLQVGVVAESREGKGHDGKPSRDGGPFRRRPHSTRPAKTRANRGADASYEKESPRPETPTHTTDPPHHLPRYHTKHHMSGKDHMDTTRPPLEPLERHQKPRCQAMSKQTGQQCGNKAIPGGTVCRFHGGGNRFPYSRQNGSTDAPARADADAFPGFRFPAGGALQCGGNVYQLCAHGIL